MRLRTETKGFTLIELLVVIVIIGVLASLALPQLIRTIERARTAEARANLGDLRSSLQRFLIENVVPTQDCGLLDVDDPGCANPGGGGPTPRYYDYAILLASPPCDPDAPPNTPPVPASRFFVAATRTAVRGRPAPPPIIPNQNYNIVLSEGGNFCDTL